MNGNRGHLDRTIAVVHNLCAGSGGNPAIRADCNGKDGRNGDGHGSGSGITAQGAVLRGTQRDAGAGGTAGCLAGIRSVCYAKSANKKSRVNTGKNQEKYTGEKGHEKEATAKALTWEICREKLIWLF